mgnify:CR=1 FL=1
MLQLRNDPLGGGFNKFAQGGFVSGPAGVDKVPARLTAGEFVMSKGAVQKYGTNTLAAMNAAGGGTNRPTPMGGYFGGGEVKSYKELLEKGGSVEDNNYGNIREIKVLFPVKKSGLFGRRRTRRTNDFLIQDRSQMNIPIEDFINMKLFDGGSKAKAENTSISSCNTSISSGLGVGAVKDMVNMEGYKKPDVKPPTEKKSGSSGILGPISSDVNAMVNSSKYEVKSKTPKNTVVAYEQEVNKNQKQKTAPASGGNEIPSFDVAPIRDPLKMVTLQIVLF